jgi:hypothetical protein
MKHLKQKHQHQIQTPDILTNRLLVRHHINLLLLQVVERWQIVWHLDRHIVFGTFRIAVIRWRKRL